MKLKHFAITVFALSMTGAMAHGGYKSGTSAMSDEKELHASTQLSSGAPGTQDRQVMSSEEKKEKETILGSAEAQAPASSIESADAEAPAGYADKSAAAEPTEGQKDTQSAQAQPDAGLGASTESQPA
jgi:hypothetical protein